ncbi:hypothetical protein GCM10022197_14500 [Microlunatus spumicola]|uniref:DUF6457 domain-containing protein n=1 Tax=Microlunatus spumicola TaxID=81499 RepID=A0ABP6X4A7_9ACTN
MDLAQSTTDWLRRLADELEAGDVALDDAAVTELLDLTREAAHGLERVAGPLTTFLVGVAVGRGAGLPEAVGTATALLDEPAPRGDGG